MSFIQDDQPIHAFGHRAGVFSTVRPIAETAGHIPVDDSPRADFQDE